MSPSELIAAAEQEPRKYPATISLEPGATLAYWRMLKLNAGSQALLSELQASWRTRTSPLLKSTSLGPTPTIRGGIWARPGLGITQSVKTPTQIAKDRRG